MSFGNKIQKIRKERNLTQEELGKELYVTRAAVSKWERDLCLPGDDTLERICELYNISIDELLDKKDILKNSNNIKKASKRILMLSIIGGSILICIIIALLVNILSRKDVYDEYYASFTGLDESYLYAETKNGLVSIPRNMIMSIKENDEIVNYDELKLRDYGLIERKNNQFFITITDHELDGIIASSDACGFVLSFQDNLSSFENDNSVPYYYNSDFGESALIFARTNLNKPLGSDIFDLSFTYDPFNQDTKNGYVNLYEIIIENNNLALRLYQKLDLQSNYKYSLVSPNEEYTKSKLYSNIKTFNFDFSRKDRKNCILYQYDMNMNLLGSVSLENNYLDDFPAKETITSSAFFNLLYSDVCEEIINANSVKQAFSYSKFIPYKSGFYSWF